MSAQIGTKGADVEAILYNVEEAATALRLSRDAIYELIRSDQLHSIKVGRRRLISVAACATWVATCEGRET